MTASSCSGASTRPSNLLVTQAEHEDTHLVPVMAELLPELNATIQHDHAVLEARLEDLQGWARDAVAAPDGEKPVRP